MNVQRCPECGQRLNTNYCDICMRKVPFGGVKLGKRQDPWDSSDGSSAHRMEKGHECVSFDTEKKPVKTTFTKPRRKTAAPNKKGASVVAIVLAVFSLLPALFGIIEETIDSAPVPEPEYNVHDGFVEAGELGAEGVPAVIPGEIYNANGIRITVDDAGLSYGDYTIFFTVYNDTNRKINVNFENISVNSFMLPFGAYQEVRSGKTEQFSIAFYADELEKAGIEQVFEVAFEVYAYEANSYDDIVVGDLVTLYTDADLTMVPALDISGLELYNDGSLWIVLRDVNLNEYGECELDLYMENLSGSAVSVYSGQVFVNGEEVSGYMWKALRPDTRAIDSCYIYELDERVDLNITDLAQIKEITIDLYVEYTDGLDILETVSEAVTFEPSAIT